MSEHQSPLTIWFVASGEAHLEKNRPFLKRLTDLGHSVIIYVRDPAYPRDNWDTAYVKHCGFPYRFLHFPRRTTGKLLRDLLDRPRLHRAYARELCQDQVAVVMIGADSSMVSRQLVTTARRLGICCISIPDGLVLEVPETPKPWYRKGVGRLYRSLLTSLGLSGERGTSGFDGVFCMNRTGLAVLQRAGVPQDKLFHTGCPDYDNRWLRLHPQSDAPSGTPAHPTPDTDTTPTHADSTVSAMNQTLSIDPATPVVTFAHQPFIREQDDLKELITDIHAGVVAGGGVLLVKFHPRMQTTMAQWQQWAQAALPQPERIRFIRDQWSPADCLQRSITCVTVASTVAVDALLLGVPLVLVQYLALPLRLPFGDRYQAALIPGNGQQLQDILQRLVKDPEYRRQYSQKGQDAAVEELRLDGHCVDRMTSLFEQLTRR